MTAGLGTRLRPYTEHWPKPALPLLGIPCAAFAIQTLRSSGVTDIVCNVHHQGEKLKEVLSSVAGKAKLHWSDETRKLLGSWGGIANAQQIFKGDRFFWINGDVINSFDIQALADRHQELVKKKGVEITLLVTDSNKMLGAYREMLLDKKQGLIQGLGEVKKNVNFFASAAVVEKSVLSKFAKDTVYDFVKDYLQDAVERKKVGFCFQDDLFWADMGDPKLWWEAHFQLIEKLEAEKLPDIWLEELLKKNTRIAKGLWVHKSLVKRPELKNLKTTGYYGEGAEAFLGLKDVGSKNVFYGELPPGKISTQGNQLSFFSKLTQF